MSSGAQANTIAPAAVTPGASTTQPAAATAIAETEEALLASILADESLLYALALFFLAGIGLAFTPCVLPMVPILSSIIVGEGDDISKRRAFTLSLAYVLGMAVTYAFVGTLVGLFVDELIDQGALFSKMELLLLLLLVKGDLFAGGGLAASTAGLLAYD